MKKILLFIMSLSVAALVGVFVYQAWQSTFYVRQHGTEATLVPGDRYNSSRWAEPLPLKKLRAYTATLAPNHEVIIVSDQDLIGGRQYFIRFLARDQTPAAPNASLRPIPGRLRPRAASDGKPEKNAGTQKLDRLLDRAMGTDETAKPSPPLQLPQLPDQRDGAVPFLFVEANESTFETLWSNSRVGEWLAVFFGALLAKVLFLQACATPWRMRHSPAEEKEFVSPALQTVDPDPPPTFPRPIPIPFKPSSSASPPQPAPVIPPEPLLKLPREAKPDEPAQPGV